MEQIKKYLTEFVNNPFNAKINFNLGYAYEIEKQYASAFSYYLRCAEFTEDKVLGSEALLRCSLCLNNQGDRDQKELYFIEHSISTSPNSLEPYLLASRFYSWRSGNIPKKRLWLKSYMYACMGINIFENNMQEHRFTFDIGYKNYELYYQKAFAGTNIGKIDEAREIYMKILSLFQISDTTKSFIINKLNQLPEPQHPIISYSKNNINKLKLLFNNSEKIDNNFSQIYQDMYVLSMHNGKMNGTYLEIGAGDYKYGNNTYLLESEFNWTGVSIDFNQNLVNNFNQNRNNNCICSDATTIDYLELLKNNYQTENIDYLQLDCDPPNITFDILSKIPFDQYKFGVITYEHDYYNDVTGSYREKSRDFLKDKGYKLIAGNISPYSDKCPFEDWWIHPELIDENIWKLFERDHNKAVNGEKYMLTKSKYIPIKKKQEKAIITFGTDDLFKNQKIRFKEQATDINFFDSIIIEDEKTIKPLLKEHEEFIMNNKIGYGYWIWKPIIIKNQLEKMSENDILFYLDCGSSIINNNTDKLNEYTNILKDKDIMVFDADYLTKKFIKKNVINEFNLNKDVLDNNLIEAGCVIIKKTDFSLKFINLWLDIMSKNNYSLINDDLLNHEQDKEFIEHRHDQSILTILARQYDNVYINNGVRELYNAGPIFHSRLTDQGERQYAKSIPIIKNIDINSNSLETLGIKYNTDKVDSSHTYKNMNYCNIYEKYFYKIKDKVTKFVEIGIKDACSLKMWKEYFPNAIIYGIDIDPMCKQYEEDRIKCLIGDQNDEKFLLNIKDIIGDYDILLDDGSHITEHQIKSFDILYENCRKNGFYIIEDLRCSYEEYLNHHDIRNCWPGMKYNKIDDQLKNYREDFVKFTEDKIKKLNFHNSGKMFAVHYYPMIIIFENYSHNFSKNFLYNNPNEYSEISNDAKIYDNITKKINPNIIVLDNFYDDPDKIREYALSLNYQSPENHGAVGYRCVSGRKIQDGTKELFEKLLHSSIPDGNNIGEWNYSTNGCFQWCNASVPIVYHCDSQKYAGIIYLTPDAPPNCGTSFFRHKKYKLRNGEIFGKNDWYDSSLKYKEPHLDKTQWEVVDSIGNVYNRLVIFDAQYIHAVSEYFGENINNSRLFQLFFFNTI